MDAGASDARPVGELLAGSAGFLLSRIGFQSSQRFVEQLAPLGLEPRHFALMRYVDAAEGRSQQALGEALSIPPSRMVALVDEVERAGLVERRVDPSDRRIRALYLTPAGRRRLAEAMDVAVRHERELCAGLSDDEQGQLLELLRKVASNQPLPIGVHPSLLGGHGWPRLQGPPGGEGPPQR